MLDYSLAFLLDKCASEYFLYYVGEGYWNMVGELVWVVVFVYKCS